MDKYDTSQLTEFPRFEPESNQSGVSTFFNKLWKFPIFSPNDTGENSQEKPSDVKQGPGDSNDQNKVDNDDTKTETGSYAVEFEGRSLANVLKRISSLVALGSGGGTRYADTELARYWMPDDISRECYECAARFSTLRRRHHCRVCGQIFCSRCCSQRVPGQIFGCADGLRVCNYCCNVVLSYLKENDMTGDISPDLRTLQENLQVKFPDNKCSSSKTMGQDNFMFSRDQEERCEVRSTPKETLQDIYRQLSLSLPTQQHRYRLVRYIGVWRGCDMLQWIMDNTNNKTRSQAWQTCASLVSSGRVVGVCELPHFADYGLYRPAHLPHLPHLPQGIDPTHHEHHAHQATAEEPSRLLESVSSYCLDLNIDKSSARLIKAPRTEVKSSPSSEEDNPVLEQSEGYPESKKICKAIEESGEDHLRLLMRQCLAREGLAPVWADVLYPLCQRAAEIINLDMNSNEMDVRNYVQVKKVPGGTAADSHLVHGVVLTKNVAHRGMPQQIDNPTVLLLDCSIAYQRVEGKLTSLEPVLLQEQQYLVRCAARIVALRPRVVLVRGRAARGVQDALRGAGVALAARVPERALRRLARAARADLVASVDARIAAPRLGTCRRYYVRAYPSKTLMILEGCAEPNLGCCILLRGSSLQELIRVKKVAKFMLLACYNWKLEKAFLGDIEATLPEPGMTFDDDADANTEDKNDITNSNDDKDETIAMDNDIFNNADMQADIDDNESSINKVMNNDIEKSNVTDASKIVSSGESISSENNDNKNKIASGNESNDNDNDSCKLPKFQECEDPLQRAKTYVRKTDNEKTFSGVPIQDFSDPLHSTLSVDDEVFLPKEEAKLKADNHTDRWSTDDVVLSMSPNVVIPAPYADTEAGRRCGLRQYFTRDLLPQPAPAHLPRPSTPRARPPPPAPRKVRARPAHLPRPSTPRARPPPPAPRKVRARPAHLPRPSTPRARYEPAPRTSRAPPTPRARYEPAPRTSRAPPHPAQGTSPPRAPPAPLHTPRKVRARPAHLPRPSTPRARPPPPAPRKVRARPAHLPRPSTPRARYEPAPRTSRAPPHPAQGTSPPRAPPAPLHTPRKVRARPAHLPRPSTPRARYEPAPRTSRAPPHPAQGTRPPRAPPAPLHTPRKVRARPAHLPRPSTPRARYEPAPRTSRAPPHPAQGTSPPRAPPAPLHTPRKVRARPAHLPRPSTPRARYEPAPRTSRAPPHPAQGTSPPRAPPAPLHTPRKVRARPAHLPRPSTPRARPPPPAPRKVRARPAHLPRPSTPRARYEPAPRTSRAPPHPAQGTSPPRAPPAPLHTPRKVRARPAHLPRPSTPRARYEPAPRTSRAPPHPAQGTSPPRAPPAPPTPRARYEPAPRTSRAPPHPVQGTSPPRAPPAPPTPRARYEPAPRTSRAPPHPARDRHRPPRARYEPAPRTSRAPPHPAQGTSPPRAPPAPLHTPRKVRARPAHLPRPPHPAQGTSPPRAPPAPLHTPCKVRARPAHLPRPPHPAQGTSPPRAPPAPLHTPRATAAARPAQGTSPPRAPPAPLYTPRKVRARPAHLPRPSTPRARYEPAPRTSRAPPHPAQGTSPPRAPPAPLHTPRKVRARPAHLPRPPHPAQGTSPPRAPPAPPTPRARYEPAPRTSRAPPHPVQGTSPPRAPPAPLHTLCKVRARPAHLPRPPHPAQGTSPPRAPPAPPTPRARYEPAPRTSRAPPHPAQGTSPPREIHPFIKHPLTASADDPAVKAALANYRATGCRLVSNEHKAECPLHEPSVVKKAPKEVELETKEKQSESSEPLDPLAPENHQRISLLLYSYSNKSANVPDFCVNPWIVKIEMYGRHDISLGAFLQKYCFNPDYKCPSSNCQVPMNQHIRKFVHDDVCITITCNTIGHSNVDKTKAESKQVAFWSRCSRCGAGGGARRVSPAALTLSLGAYVRARAAAPRYVRPRLCAHPLHAHAHAFVAGLTTACFRYNKIEPYDIQLPPEVIYTKYDTKQMRDALIQQLNDLMLKGHETFSCLTESDAEKEYQSFKQHMDQVHLALTSGQLQELTSPAAVVRSLWSVSDRIVSGEKMLRDAQDKWSTALAKSAKAHSDTSAAEEKSDLEDSIGESGIEGSGTTYTFSDNNSKEPDKEHAGTEEDEEKGDKKTVKQILSQLLSNNQPSHQGGMIIWSGLVPVVVQAGEIGSVIAATLASLTYQRAAAALTATAQQATLAEIDESDTNSSAGKDKTDGDKNKSTKSNDHIEVLLKDGLLCRVYYAPQFHKLRHMLLAPLSANPHIKDEFTDNTGEQAVGDGRCSCEDGRDKSDNKSLCEIEEGFVRSLAHCVPWAARGGKSGSTFCKTDDDRYVLKEMTKPEWQQFLEFAPHYFNYVTHCHQNKLPSLLARILGVYSVGGAGGVLAMENIWYGCGAQHKRFDLKGSSRHRLAPDTQPLAVLMDENLLNLRWQQQLHVASASARVVWAGVERDCSFLAARAVMDYSLLLGLQRRTLVLGIIDYIRTFTWDKKLEHLVKKNLGSGQPTVVSPEEYKQRFCAACRKYFLQCPAHWDHLYNTT
ncbi:putative 1-phosphatidylinositol 3-phosphate 5-kinase [Achroia grisella]|uniref:putative 1-phosphatidylinositol 3-phosphate 5-kinase n=1 Tax=Achroia grisella TaxID=688607 RepID=UPI0027D1EFD2|nr:putative 1-phosphatidylinositol 3-phosphate 5-kinase [Achroia grisella]